MLSKDEKEMLERLSTGDDHRYGEYYGEALHHLIGLGYVKVSPPEPRYPADRDGAMKRSLSLTVIGRKKIEELRVKAAAERDPAVAAHPAVTDSRPSAGRATKRPQQAPTPPSDRA
jgi:hypothetical protein